LGFFFGDAKRMAADVDKALTEIVAACGKLTAEDAVAYVAQLKKAGVTLAIFTDRKSGSNREGPPRRGRP
jgi:hypothetical protein